MLAAKNLQRSVWTSVEGFSEVEKDMVAHHKPNIVKDLVVPSKMKVFREIDLKASAHVEK